MALLNSSTLQNANMLLQSISGVSSTPVTILGSNGPGVLNTRRIDSLNFVNTSMSSSSIDCQIIRINNRLGANECYLFRNYAFAAFEHKNCHDITPIYLNAGDSLIANSNSFKNKFDILVSYTEFSDPSHTIISTPLISLKQDIQHHVVMAAVNPNKSIISGTIAYIADCIPDIYNGVYVISSVPNASSNTFSFPLKTNKQETLVKLGNIYVDSRL